MIAIGDMKRTAREYLRAARLLNRKASSSPDASVYLCGYAVEIALKARICQTLGWASFPETPDEFNNYRSFQTHDFNVLLHLAGWAVEGQITLDPVMLVEWSTVGRWKPEQRYKPIGTKTVADATDMIAAAAKVLRVLL